MEQNLTGNAIVHAEGAADHECDEHGSVVAFYPLSYQDHERRIAVASGPFCMMCMIERQNKEYAGCVVKKRPGDDV